MPGTHLASVSQRVPVTRSEELSADRGPFGSSEGPWDAFGGPLGTLGAPLALVAQSAY